MKPEHIQLTLDPSTAKRIADAYIKMYSFVYRLGFAQV